MVADVGGQIKMYRMRMGLTQSQLGSLLDVQKSAIQKYENGSIDLKLSTLVKLAEVFEVSLTTLLGDTPSTKELNELLYDSYGAIALELFRLFGDLDDVGKMKVLAYTQDIGATYNKKGDDA